MALIIGDNFSYLGAKPLDGRLSYATISAMAGMAASSLYDGIMAFCVETGKEYQWKSANTEDPTLGKWREFTVSVPTAYTSDPEMDGKAAAGSSTSWAKGDHVHPSDTTKADKVSGAKNGNFAGLDANGNLTDSGKTATDFAKILTVADAFDSTATYNIGDRCTYNGAFYKFTAAHTGAWDAQDVAELTINEAILSNTIGIGGGYAPIGTIISYMGTTAPQDYLACDGSTKNIADYPQLAEFFAAQFGSANFFGGNGTTTFAVPDLRGEFLRGTGTNSHANQGSGESVGVHQDGTVIHDYIDGGYKVRHSDDDYTTELSEGTNAESNNVTNISHNFTSRPTNTSILYCIKAVVAGEVYSTEEQVVGTWIDGKPVYQKTITGLNIITSWVNQYHAENASVSALITDVDKVIKCFGCGTQKDAGDPIYMDLGVQIKSSSTWLIMGIDPMRINIITLRYTKTT